MVVSGASDKAREDRDAAVCSFTLSECKHGDEQRSDHIAWEEDDDMGTLTIRRLDDQVIERLKGEARAHGRSMESEVRSILEDHPAAYIAHEEMTVGDFFDRIRAELDGELEQPAPD